MSVGQGHAVQADDRLLPVEHPQHDVLAVDRGLGGNAEIHRAAVQREREPPVLRRARLRDVHAADDLDAHGDAGHVGLVEAPHRLEHAVDAVADAQERVLGLEVDVGGAALHRVDEQRVDKAHHRLRVLVAARLQALVVDLAGLDLLQDAVDRQLVAVELVDVVLELGFGRELCLDLDLRAEHRAQLVHRDDVEDLASWRPSGPARRVEGDRQDAVAAREILRHELQRLGIGDDLGKVDRLLADRARHDVADGGLGNEAEAHQQAPERDVVVALLGERDGELVGGDQPLLNEQLAEPEFLPSVQPRRPLLFQTADGAGARMRSRACERLKFGRACAPRRGYSARR